MSRTEQLNFVVPNPIREDLDYAARASSTKLSPLMRDLIPSKDLTDALVAAGAAENGIPETIRQLLRNSMEAEMRAAGCLPEALTYTSHDPIFRLYTVYKRALQNEPGYFIVSGFRGNPGEEKRYILPCVAADDAQRGDFVGMKQVWVDAADWWKNVEVKC